MAGRLSDDLPLARLKIGRLVGGRRSREQVLQAKKATQRAAFRISNR
jgi:hypothetical protein